jgi:copper transport protein
VWGRRAPAVDPDERERALGFGRDLFWVTFGVLAVGAMLAEGYLLVVKTASSLGVSVLDALRDPGGIAQVLGDTRFGDILQVRGALLFVLFGIGVWQFLSEYGSDASPRPATPSGRTWPAVAMAALAVTVVGSISYQGHASTAPLPWLQIPLDALHLVAVATWVAGLALTGLVLWRLPRIIPRSGPAIAAAELARFSRVALVAVGVALITGVARSVAELSDPVQLWDTDYGVSILIKIGLLVPVGILALMNRKVVTSLRRVRRPSRATLRMVRTRIGAELVLTLAIVVVASLLVAQVPGRL